MSRQEPTTRSIHDAGAPATGSVQSAQPLPAAKIYSADLVQRLLDRAAYFNLYSSPEPRDRADSDAGTSVIRNAQQTIGFRLRERLRRFEIVMQVPTKGRALSASNIIGEQLGAFDSRWLLCPDDFKALPGREPPATRLDSTRQQRFVMLDGDCKLGEDGDGFRGFGTGTTFRSADGTLLASAVGNVLEGRGRLAGLAGIYTYCGSLDEGEGFQGSLMLRVMDPEEVIQTVGTLPTLDAGGWAEPGITYLMFRGQATESDKVAPLIGANGQLQGLNVAQQLRLFLTDASARGRGGLRSTSQIGQVIGEIDAQIIFNPSAPGGGPLDPIPYTAYDEYKFTDSRGESVGSLFIDEGEGRTFNMPLAGAPGQPAIRFGGFGPILRGSGSLVGAEGLMTDNSVVSFTPHVSASVYVIRVNDPEGKYRVGGSGRDC